MNIPPNKQESELSAIYRKLAKKSSRYLAQTFYLPKETLLTSEGAQYFQPYLKEIFSLGSMRIVSDYKQWSFVADDQPRLYVISTTINLADDLKQLIHTFNKKLDPNSSAVVIAFSHRATQHLQQLIASHHVAGIKALNTFEVKSALDANENLQYKLINGTISNPCNKGDSLEYTIFVIARKDCSSGLEKFFDSLIRDKHEAEAKETEHRSESEHEHEQAEADEEAEDEQEKAEETEASESEHESEAEHEHETEHEELESENEGETQESESESETESEEEDENEDEDSGSESSFEGSVEEADSEDEHEVSESHEKHEENDEEGESEVHVAHPSHDSEEKSFLDKPFRAVKTGDYKSYYDRIEGSESVLTNLHQQLMDNNQKLHNADPEDKQAFVKLYQQHQKLHQAYRKEKVAHQKLLSLFAKAKSFGSVVENANPDYQKWLDKHHGLAKSFQQKDEGHQEQLTYHKSQLPREML